MNHALEQFSDGSTSFFSAREVAWHKLGTVTPDCLTAADALKVAQMDWHVYKTTEPVTMSALTPEGVAQVEVDGKFATYRLHPKTGQPEALGVVGRLYTPVQNVEAFDFLSLLVDEHGAVFETAGSLHGGKQVFVTMKMPKTIHVGGHDKVETYLVATNAHDGTGSFKVAVTPIRVVCQNTLNMALRGNRNVAAMRHTSGVSHRVQQARETLGMTFSYMEAFEKQAEALISQEMTDRQFVALVDSLVKPKKEESTRSDGNAENVKRDLMGLWRAETQANVANTKWAAYNVFTEYADWFKPVKAKGQDKDTLRALRVMDGKVDAIKDKALAMLV